MSHPATSEANSARKPSPPASGGDPLLALPDAFDTAPMRIVAGKYRLDALIAENARGEIHRATRLDTGDAIAVKLLDDKGDAEFRARFLREAGRTSWIRHPGIAEVFEAGADEDGTLFVAMELLDGGTVAEHLERNGPVHVREAVGIVAGVCSALGVLHAKGLIHGGVNPGSIFLADREGGGRDVKLIDFGLARREVVLQPATSQGGTLMSLAHAASKRLVVSAVVWGTPRYLSPEQAAGEPVDARTDVYGLAITLYEMLAGKPPFYTASTTRDWLEEILYTEAEPIASVSVHRAIEETIRRGLSKNPADRHASAADFANALWTALADAQGVSSRPAGVPARSTAATVAIGAAVLLIAAGTTLGPCARRSLPASARTVSTAGVAPAMPRPSIDLRVAPEPPAAPEPPSVAAAPAAPAVTAETTAAHPAQRPLPARTASVTTTSTTTRTAPASPATTTPAPVSPPPTGFRIDDLKVPYH